MIKKIMKDISARCMKYSYALINIRFPTWCMKPSKRSYQVHQIKNNNKKLKKKKPLSIVMHSLTYDLQFAMVLGPNEISSPHKV
jgi:hypothetical protein